MSNSETRIIYDIDKYNVIRRIAGSWDAFREENRVQELAIERVVGVSLWEFVIGKDLRRVYEKVIALVRDSRKPLSFPFRCDSPDTIRLMHMDVSPEQEGGVRFVTTPLEIRPRPRQLYYNYVAHGNRCHVFSCSICNRVRNEESWVQLEEALHRKRLLDSDKPLSLYGALCPECKEKMDTLVARTG